MTRLLLRGLQGGKQAFRRLILRGRLRSSRPHNGRLVPHEMLSKFREDDSVKILLRSIHILDEWLKNNEGKLEDEVRVQRIKRWREEAIEQLRLKLRRR
jgi:hypothetical protein